LTRPITPRGTKRAKTLAAQVQIGWEQGFWECGLIYRPESHKAINGLTGEEKGREAGKLKIVRRKGRKRKLR